jgi:hypothetical protein
MANGLGAMLANAMGAGARVLGHGIYWLLRIIYRRKEKLVAIGVVLAAIVAALAVWWLLA